MPADASASHTRTGGLGAALRRLGATFFALLHTRIELLTTELQRERVRITRLLLLLIVALFFLTLGAITLTVFVIALFWDTHHRLLAIGLLTLLYLGVAVGLALFAKREAARSMSPFSASLAQLKKDREQLLSR
ncbi:MAG TPA: phage holin family protein [Burkholderiales bacterium]|nr:phage holin family protein [Burkholderiales bacterium]